MANFLFGEKGYGHFQSLQDLMASEKFRSTRTSPSRSTGAASGNFSDDRKANMVEDEYIIDPITNRKRPRNPARNTLRTDGTQAAIFYDGPPPEAELLKYDQVKIDPMPWDQTQAQNTAPEYPSRQEKQPILESDEYIRNHSGTVQTEDGVSSPSSGRQSVSWHRIHGIVPPADTNLDVKDNVKSWCLNPDFFNLDSVNTRKPAAHHENAAIETSLPQYDDLHKYKPVMVGEEDGNKDKPSKYEDLDKYNAFNYQEPDPSLVVEEQAPVSELEKYQPYRHNEPDGKREIIEEPEVAQEELKKYQPFRYNEPDGVSPTVEEDNACDPAELQKYRPFMYNEPDGKPPGYSDEGNGCDPSELRKYGAFRYNEPDGKPPLASEQDSGPSPDELQKYKPFRHNEPDGIPLSETEEGASAEELNRYNAVKWNEPDGKPVVEVDPTIQSLEDFELKSNDVEQPSNVVFSRTFPANPASEQEKAEDLDLLRASDIRAAAGIVPPSAKTPEEKSNYRKTLESLMAQQAEVSDMADAEAISAVRESRLKSGIHSQRQQGERKVTGNYVQDFPEDFEKSWTTEATSDASLLPIAGGRSATLDSTEQEIQKAEREQVEGAVFDSAATLQPALDRQKRPARPYSSRKALDEAIIDPYSKEPQGLETSYTEECAGQSTWPTYVRHYGNADSTLESTAGAPKSVNTTTPESTIYKVLAYDHATRTVNVAETSSMISDSSSPMTPAEVILRLSNPAKFFPHFQPLQEQGFEIISGSGDVLVFRKVRPASSETSQRDTTPQGEELTSARTATSDTPSTSPINPIDMTGGGPRGFPSPSTSMFTSPTGFVNYDLPEFGEASSAEPKPTGRFSSGINVQREEPVFSGAKSEQRDGAKKFPKRVVVGAAWVAGISYALGVMGEYFKTGGADGKGPNGL